MVTRTTTLTILTAMTKSYEHSRNNRRDVDEAYDDANQWAEQVFRSSHPGPLDLALRRFNYAWRKDLLY